MHHQFGFKGWEKEVAAPRRSSAAADRLRAFPVGSQESAFCVRSYFVLIYLEAEKESYDVETVQPNLPRSPGRPISFSAPESPPAVICIIYSSDYHVQPFWFL